MSIKTSTTRKVPTLGAVFQTMKDNPRVYDTFHGLDKRIKALVTALISNALKAPGVISETLFLGYFNDGGNVFVASIPNNYTSPIDGYKYAQDEVLSYEWSIISTRTPMGPFTNGQLTDPGISAANSGAGQLFWFHYNIDSTTGAVTTTVSYFVTGGAETITTDGYVKVFATVRRKTFPA